MSRKTARNATYTMSFGVDHTPMGRFVQIYETAAVGEDVDADETDQPQIDIDEMFGLRVNNLRTLERNPRLAKALLPLGKNINYLRNEESVVAIGRVLGFNISKDVYELWELISPRKHP